MARVWIIGASHGIGRALAAAYAAKGAELILSARDGAALAALGQALPGAKILPLDLGVSTSLQQACAQIPPQSLDVIHCTAALYEPGLVRDMTQEALSQILAVNIAGTFLLAKDAPLRLREGGQLVLYGSVAGYFGLPKGQPYSATKAAIINLAESLKVELAPKVDVRLVSPGFVSTRLTDKNAFTMPAITTPDAAAAAIIRGLDGRGFELHFPRRFTFMIKLLRLLPYPLALWLTKRLMQQG